MPLTTRAKAKKAKKPRVTPPLSNQQLLALAKKRRPPQTWYDERANPFQPKR